MKSEGASVDITCEVNFDHRQNMVFDHGTKVLYV